MQKIQDSVFSIVKTTNLSPAVFNFLQPSDEFEDKTPLGGILKDTKYGWLALGPKFCVVDLRTGLKVAARTFGASHSNNTTVTCVVELPRPLTENSQQLLISLQCDDIGMICVLHVNGSQILRCMQTDVVVTELAICDRIPDGPFTCFDELVMAGTKRGEIFAFDLNRASLIQALEDVSQGYEHLVLNESNPTSLSFLPLNAIQRIEEQRELALENDHHLAILLNENSMVDGQYIFRNPDGTVRMKAKRDHIRVTVLQYIPQLGSMAVGFNFGAFQLWNLMTLDLEFTSQVNVECLPVTHFAFQEPCDDPRAFCYLWVVFSVIDRYDEEEFPLAVMYSLTYQGKRMLSDTKCLYQDFSSAAVRFQVELSTMEQSPLLGGKCISCHSYSIKSTLGGDEGEDSILNICQLVWECWGEDANSPMQYGMLLFDLDQWYKDQMPATYSLESNAFMSTTWCTELTARGSVTLHARLDPESVCSYSHATRLEEHFFPNSLQYNCICLNTCEALTLRTVGIQRQIVAALEAAGGAALLHPQRLHAAAARAGLAPQHAATAVTVEDQRRYLLSVALEARLSRFLKRCAHDWATGSHAGVGCTLPFLVDWAWKRALELKENAKDLTAPLFISSALPDGNVIRCLEHCVQQLTQLTGLMDAILTKCCNLVVPDALSEMEEVHVGIGCVSLYFQVVQWFLRVGLLPERPGTGLLPYPHQHLTDTYNKRRIKLNRLQDISNPEDNGANKSCSLLYIDQLIENECGGDKIHQLWINGGSECNGLYPPPSLYSLLRLYLLPEIAEEQKHSLVLYLLVDYSMIYDDVRYEAVIRRLMQFPTMFGLSNTAIKATQAFWHLDHRDFDFALDQLQCLTGNTLHEWQHNVVLSSLLAQKKTQAALQYLHVRKPAPVKNKDGDAQIYSQRLNSQDKVSEWQSCCSLYLARGLIYEALEVVRMCAQNASTVNDKAHVLNYFFKGCRNTGNLSKLLQVILLPFEEEVFVKYLENCNESQTSDLLIMFYLQQARYLEAERYNSRIKKSKPPRNKELSTSVESLYEVCDREGARDALVEVVCAALPSIAGTVAQCARQWSEIEPHVHAPKPMSVFVQAKSPKNTFTYKSSFIQDTIENASETWMNRPKMRKGLKRALDIEETPFICTPKLIRTRSVFTDQLQSDSTPPKRARLSVPSGTPHTPKMNTSSYRVSEKLSKQMEELLDMPDMQSPVHMYRDRAETPHSILKIRRNERDEAVSPVDSRYLGDSDDELLETASSHTHYSDSNNKHLRFTIPTASESGSTPSPLGGPIAGYSEVDGREKDVEIAAARERDTDISADSYFTTASHTTNENNPLESPPKKVAAESTIQPRRSYKDIVRARLSLSANSSLSEDPNTSIESIADIPVTLINPRYSGERKRTTPSPIPNQENKQEQNLSTQDSEQRNFDQTNIYEDVDLSLEQSNFQDTEINLTSTLSSRQIRNLEQPNFSLQDIEYKQGGEKREVDRLDVSRTPRGRRGIRSVVESTPVLNRSRSVTPDRQDSPVVTPMRSSRITRSRSRSKTPELSPRSSPLAPILEQPAQEHESETHTTTLTVPRQLRSRSRTPERLDKGVSESPKLEVINESPTKLSDSPPSSPSRRSLRSRSRSPGVEIVLESTTVPLSPRSLRSRSKTPEKLMSPKKEYSVRTKKSLSRIVLEQNTFAKTKQTLETLETEISESRSENIECTPMKTSKQAPSLMDVTLSPIDKSPSDGKNNAKSDQEDSELGLKTLPAFNTLHETYFGKSVLKSYQSSIADASQSIQEIVQTDKTTDSSKIFKPIAFTTINETDFNKSVLHSYESSVAEISQEQEKETLPKPFAVFASMIDTDFEKSVLHSHQSSIATPDASKTQDANASSLITNDSDVDVKETEIQDRAERKEKERIVEIEREINEIEEGISDDSERESDSSVESVNDESSGERESEESDSSEEQSTSETDEHDENEVISIADSDSSNSESNTKIDSNTNNIDVYNVEDNLALMENFEGSLNDPPNQDRVSLLTDDNSNLESDQSRILNYSDDKYESISEGNRQPKEQEAPIEVQIKSVEEILSKDQVKVDEPTPAPEGTDVVDASASKIEIKETALPEVTKSEENMRRMKIEEGEKVLAVVEETKDQTVEPEKSREPDQIKSDKSVKIIDLKQIVEEMSTKIETVDKPSEPIQASETETSDQTKGPKEITETETPAKRSRKGVRSTSSIKSTKSEPEISKSSKDKDTIAKEKESALPVINESKEIDEDSSKDKVTDSKSKETTLPIIIQESIDEPKTPRTRKRANSNASAKSKANVTAKEPTEEKEEPKTPVTRRKRNQSNASKDKDNTEENTPENTPTKRAKTPTSTEIRRIVTRRFSKEMREKLVDKSNESIEFVSLTPKKRSVRSNSKNMDDNESVASESSVVSNRSRASEDAEMKPVRKGRKSVLPTKPDLSVIPEVIAEESKEQNVVAGYSGGRRVRGQLLAPETVASPRGRRRVSSSRTSHASLSSLCSEVEDEPLPGFDVEPIDRISLLNKTDFEGSPDNEEMQNMSPESMTSDVSKTRRSRLVRAVSESRTAPRPAKIGRRVASVDVAVSSEIGSPGTESPVRGVGRRASFNRAIEALHTPKGRRTSNDLRSPVASPAASEADATPARRPRRASTHSNTSLTKSDTGKRSKKMPVLEEEDKETKK